MIKNGQFIEQAVKQVGYSEKTNGNYLTSSIKGM